MFIVRVFFTNKLGPSVLSESIVTYKYYNIMYINYHKKSKKKTFAYIVKTLKYAIRIL